MNETITLPENPSIAKRGTVRLTTAQSLVRYLSGLRTRVEGPQGEEIVPLFGGVFAIFGHGNVAGIGEALYQYRDQLPTFRAHNEQAMAHAAIAYSKAHFRRRLMACTTSIGPGATNLLTAAALAHVNRLPVLFLLGDIFVSRDPDPVLQQVEDFSDGKISANDCFRPVSRWPPATEFYRNGFSTFWAASALARSTISPGWPEALSWWRRRLRWRPL